MRDMEGMRENGGTMGVYLIKLINRKGGGVLGGGR
jgi:hypothetical protein